MQGEYLPTANLAAKPVQPKPAFSVITSYRVGGLYTGNNLERAKFMIISDLDGPARPFAVRGGISIEVPK